jgi:hypothetical protein
VGVIEAGALAGVGVEILGRFSVGFHIPFGSTSQAKRLIPSALKWIHTR